MTKYLQHFPKPLLDDLVAGRWLPVIGAGMSLNARVEPPKKMPLWPDLGTTLSGELSDFTFNGTLDAISAYQHEFGRAKLIERLIEILCIREAVPGEAHKAFCSIPFDIVCTTNFDFLLERQYDAIPRFVYPVVDEEQLSVNGSTAGTLLLKLHGDLRHPSRLVVTEEDYDGFLARYPLLATYLANLLITKTAVFVGYSLDDPDFRQIWTIVSDRLGRTRRFAYSIMVDARPTDIARYERRGVKVVNLPGSKGNYGSILAAVFKELQDHIRENVISVSQVVEEQPLRELLLPRDAATRLCFFAIPIELLSLYRSRVFPIVEQLGFVPITADDVITPGDNVNAKIDALIDRALVMVVELSSQWTRAEFDIALARRKGTSFGVGSRRELEIIVVTPDIQQLPASAREFSVVVRSNLFTDDDDQFVDQLANRLRNLAVTTDLDRTQEPLRLLNAKEYRAAVISAMTVLETWLRSLISVPSLSSDPRRLLSLRALIEAAIAAGTPGIDTGTARRLSAWAKVRNEVVHTSATVDKKTAREIVEGVLRIVGRQ